MGRSRIVKENSGVQVVRRRLADGRIATYRYHRRTRTRISVEGLDAANLADAARADEGRRAGVAETIYFVQAQALGYIKIGMANDLKRRLCSLATASPDVLCLLGTIKRGGRTLERSLHDHFAADRVHGEWFRPSDELFRFIRERCETADA